MFLSVIWPVVVNNLSPETPSPLEENSREQYNKLPLLIAILLFFIMWDNEIRIYPPFYLSFFPYSFFLLASIRIDEKNIGKCSFSFPTLEAAGLPEQSQKTKFLLSDLVMLSAIVLNFFLFQIVIIKRVPIKWFPFVKWIMFYNVAKFYTCYEFPGQCQQNVGTFSPQQLKQQRKVT